MAQPAMTIRPTRSSFPLEGTRALELVATVEVPKPEVLTTRSPVSLAIVLDHSGSMEGTKMAFARAGASAALGQLSEEDRVSLTIFDSQVEVLQDAIAAKQAASLHAKIALIEPRSKTNLLGGWLAGANTLSGQEDAARPRRVVLLTDGLANEGVTNSGSIAAAVAEAARRGIATSAMGIGEDYNEDLLEAISRSGDGSYYYVEEADQLPGLFEAELNGFKAVVGREVALSILPAPGVELVAILNDFPISNKGTPVLPNLIGGTTQNIGFSLRAVADSMLRTLEPVEVCVVQLAWTNPETGERHELRQALRLPVAPVADYDGLAVDPTAAEAVALLRSARAKREAIRCVDTDDVEGIQAALLRAKNALSGLSASPSLEREEASIASLSKDLAEGHLARLRKSAHYESYSRSHAPGDGRFEGHINRKLIAIAAPSVTVTMGDLAKTKAEAIVNSRSDGSGLDAHLREKGGEQFRRECEALGNLRAGSIGVTSGGKLASPLVFHAVVPHWAGGSAGEVEVLGVLYRLCLKQAQERNLTHVAFPLLGAGGHGFPIPVAAQIAIVSAATSIFYGGMSLKVSFVCDSREAADALESMLNFGHVR